MDPIDNADSKSVSDACLAKLITIDEEFTQEHARQAVQGIYTLWPDLKFGDHDIYDIAQSLRQGNVVVEHRSLRAFLVASIYFPNPTSPGHVKFIADMTLLQLGPVRKQDVSVYSNEPLITARAMPDAVKRQSDSVNDNEIWSTPKQTPRTKTVQSGTTSLTKKNGSSNKQEVTPTRHDRSQILSPASPFKLLFKTQKKWARQRQLRALISQSKKPKKQGIERDDMEIKLSKDDLPEEDLKREPITVSAAEKKALGRQKLERKRKLEALSLKAKKRTF
ncbi:hypothetical protein E4T39_04746 [Aureobasidium subglaciale]|nr:hypothetical protein E4T39_04746 [Aureobasidium subglaciale]